MGREFWCIRNWGSRLLQTCLHGGVVRLFIIARVCLGKPESHFTWNTLLSESRKSEISQPVWFKFWKWIRIDIRTVTVICCVSAATLDSSQLWQDRWFFNSSNQLGVNYLSLMTPPLYEIYIAMSVLFQNFHTFFLPEAFPCNTANNIHSLQFRGYTLSHRRSERFWKSPPWVVLCSLAF